LFNSYCTFFRIDTYCTEFKLVIFLRHDVLIRDEVFLLFIKQLVKRRGDKEIIDLQVFF
jgi:hypothetical protein